MPDFLLELLSEEIPARFQERAASDLLAALLAGLPQGDGRTGEHYSGPRRIAVWIDKLPDETEAKRSEVRGPRKGAPQQALDGFLKSAGLASVEQCELRDTGKGEFYFAVKEEPGKPIDQVLAPLVESVLGRFTWPKSMRRGGNEARWVRPLHRILAISSEPGRPTHVVPVRWRLGSGEGATVIEAADLTEGHRFLAPEPFAVRDLRHWLDALGARFVVPVRDQRKAHILAEAEKLAAGKGLKLKRDEALLDEVAGLAEWPVPMLGHIEERFMALPPELLTTSMRTHQKYFACERPDGSLAPFFVVVADNVARDGGARIVAGNERVLRARLADAEFFWQQDRAAPLASRIDRLKERVFHAKLGSVYEKVERMAALALVLAPLVPGADMALAERAVRLAKADLSTSLVGEFPELQGVIGRYLALHDGEDAGVAQAIARHYAPAGLGDPAPSAPLDIVAALADKLDTLAGFFAIEELPTGSSDPYALRRAALGVIRTIRENGLRFGLAEVLRPALALQPISGAADGATLDKLLDFFADRLKVALRDEGVRHDVVASVFALGGEDDLVRLVARALALQDFLNAEDGADLLSAYRRAARILAIEEKKDGVRYEPTPDPALYQQDEERTLGEALDEDGREADQEVAQEKFVAAMATLSLLRKPVDAFFEKVTVNVEAAPVRANRLRLLARIRAGLDRVADFSRIEG